MQEKMISSLSNKEQKKLRPRIEEVIPEIISGDMQKTALEFAAYLREQKMAPGWSGVTNTWNASYKCKVIYRIQLKNDGWVNEKHSNHLWVVNPHLNYLSVYEKIIIDEGMQNLIWDNLGYCRKCSEKCAGKK